MAADTKTFSHWVGNDFAGALLVEVGGAAPQSLTLSAAAASATANSITLTPGPVSLSLATAAAYAAAFDILAFTTQYARPNADVTDGNWRNESWSQSNLYASVDEVSPNDSDYVQSEGGPSASACELGLGSLSDPAMHTQHKVAYRYKKSGAGLTLSLKVYLMEGVTEIASWTHSDVSTDWTTTEQTLAEGEAANITDYTALSVKLEANTV